MYQGMKVYDSVLQDATTVVRGERRPPDVAAVAKSARFDKLKTMYFVGYALHVPTINRGGWCCLAN